MKDNNKHKLLTAFKAAFPHTIPIMTGFLFLGMAYGIYMNVSGFPFIYPMVMALVIFGGSLEFLAVSMLLSPFAPLQTFIVTLLVQARHLFYGIALLDKYKDKGLKRFYLIYGMCDESFSINCSVDVPKGVDEGWFYFFVTLLNQSYWVTGATIGGILGDVISFNTKGLDFVMTCLFVVIFIEQLKKGKQEIPAAAGMIASLACLMVFGKDSFMIPTMVCILVLLTLLRKRIEGKGSKIEDKG